MLCRALIARIHRCNNGCGRCIIRWIVTRRRRVFDLRGRGSGGNRCGHPSRRIFRDGGRDHARRRPIGFVGALDRRIFDLARRPCVDRLIDFPGKSIERTRIEVHGLKTERLRDRTADRARIAECCGLNRRYDQMPMGRSLLLAPDQRGKVLIADRCRHQSGAERAQPKPGITTRARYPATRRRHYPSRQRAPTTRFAPRTWLWKRHRSGANATGPFIVGLTLRRR
jgi:hypothetical protein